MANTQHAVPVLKALADTYFTDGTNVDHVLMHQLLHRTIEFKRVMDASGTFFTEPELKQLAEATEGVGKYMQLLRAKAKDDNRLIWHISPKTHYMQHFPEEARLISPKVVQCYIEESYIGKVAEIWKSCKNEPYFDCIQRLALLKYLVWLCLELEL